MSPSRDGRKTGPHHSTPLSGVTRGYVFAFPRHANDSREDVNDSSHFLISGSQHVTTELCGDTAAPSRPPESHVSRRRCGVAYKVILKLLSMPLLTPPWQGLAGVGASRSRRGTLGPSAPLPLSSRRMRDTQYCFRQGSPQWVWLHQLAQATDAILHRRAPSPAPTKTARNSVGY